MKLNLKKIKKIFKAWIQTEVYLKPWIFGTHETNERDAHVDIQPSDQLEIDNINKIAIECGTHDNNLTIRLGQHSWNHEGNLRRMGRAISTPTTLPN